jgi:hypothetical protein
MCMQAFLLIWDFGLSYPTALSLIFLCVTLLLRIFVNLNARNHIHLFHSLDSAHKDSNGPDYGIIVTT